MRVRIDGDTCGGHGRCYSLAPTVFSADEIGHGVVIDEDVDGERAAAARLAVVNCPESAIVVSED